MDPKTGPIRTPDSRLRVFVSSTLRELAPERRAVRASIERIRLAPVMFELGARPHPPRALYRAYLEQSDIFVGVYWEKYGWVAPGEDVSGLEDEYNLAPPGMPRLIYIKDTAGAREDRLVKLLDRIRADDRAAFKYFSDPQELADLIVGDLAVLLAERFDRSRDEAVSVEEAPPEHRKGAPTAPIPVPLTRLFGREAEAEAIAEMMRSDRYRLVTLTGPGGIGKTRLAIEVGTRLSAEFPDGVLFVPLAPVDDPGQVANAIAHAVGVQATGDAPLEEKLVDALRDRRMLLVLDNFEQVLPAGPLIKDLVGAAPGLKVLVTSRALLRVLGEQNVEVSPLQLPAARTAEWDPGSPLSASVDLLVARARSVKPDFEVTPRNIEAVEAIATLLEGVPLALEIAAARLRMLTPADLLARLDHRLALLVDGSRSLPPRQQAVRTTIEWSTRLLNVDEQNLLWRLGVFAGRFSLEAAECIAESSADTITLLEALVDSSLLRQQERNGRSYFLMLATVREYSLEKLEEQGLVDEMRERHAGYYRTWTHQVGPDLIGPRQREYVALLNNERDNLRAAVLHLLDGRNLTGAAECAWAVWPFWWIGGMMGDFRHWMEEMLKSSDPLPDRVRAIALSVTTSVFFWDVPTPELIDQLEEAADIFERLGASFDAGVPMMSLASAYALSTPPDLVRAASTVERGLRHFRASGNRWGETVLVVAEGRLALAKGDMPGAIQRFEQALAIGRDLENYLSLSIALHYLGWARLISGQLHEAADTFSEALDVSPVIAHDQGVAWDLEGMIGIAITIGDIENAGVLAGAAAALRDRIGLQDRADAVFHRQMIEQVRQSPAAPVFDQAYAVGRRMSAADAVDLAWQVTRSVRKVPVHSA
jgi:predicted ATPase